MSKSRYSKTKASGMLCGMNRYGKRFEFRSEKNTAAEIQEVENRQMRRLREKK